MWIEIPALTKKPPLVKGGFQQGYIICSQCGTSCTQWLVADWEKWGCGHCGEPPMAPLPMAPFGHTYFNPTAALVGWDNKTPITELVKANRITKCSCNTCNGYLNVEAA